MRLRECSLEEISESIDYGLTASASAKPVGPRILRITDIQNGCVSWHSVPYCACSESDQEKYGLRPGDIVFARTGATTGKSFLITDCPEATVFASYLIRVRPKPSVHPAYLQYFFRTPAYWRQISFHTTGSTQPGMNATKLKSLTVPLLPRDEQEHIAAVLDKVDSILRKRQKSIQIADEFLRSVFIEMFGDPVTNPKAWEELPLYQVSEVRSGVAKGRNFNGRQTVTVPYMRVANVQDGHIDLTDIKEIEVFPEEVEKYRLQRGDILLTEGGDPDKLGRGAVWEDQVSPCIHQNHIFSVRINRSGLLPEFLSALIASKRGKAYFLKAGKQTTGIATINKTQLSQFPIFVPPCNLQDRYVAILTRTQHASRAQTELADKSQRLFGSLVQRAFRGEL